MSQRIQYQTFQHWANGLMSERAEKQTRMTQTRTLFLILSHWINGDLSLVKDVHACVCVCMRGYKTKTYPAWRWLTELNHILAGVYPQRTIAINNRLTRKILHITWQSHHNPLFWCSFFLSKHTRRVADVGWLYNTVTVPFHPCCTLHFHHCFTDLPSERIIMMRVVCALPSWYWSKDRINAHMHAYVWGENNKSKCFVKLCNHTWPPSFICSGIRSGCVAFSCIYSSTLPLCPFWLFSEGVFAPIQGPASFPHESSSNGKHFVRWPDSSVPPLGRRCHPHGTEEQMLAEGKERGNEMRGRWRGLTSATWEMENICLHMQRRSRDETLERLTQENIHATKHLQGKVKICSTCRSKLKFQHKLMVSSLRSIFFLYFWALFPAFILLLILFVCVCHWDRVLWDKPCLLKALYK